MKTTNMLFSGSKNWIPNFFTKNFHELLTQSTEKYSFLFVVEISDHAFGGKTVEGDKIVEVFQSEFSIVSWCDIDQVSYLKENLEVAVSTIGIGISLLLVPGVDEDVSHNSVNIIHVSLTALDSPYFKVSQDPCLNLTVFSGQNSVFMSTQIRRKFFWLFSVRNPGKRCRTSEDQFN